MTTTTEKAGGRGRKAKTRLSPKGRRTRTIRRLVISLAIVLGLLVVADFSAAAIFEYQVSKRARDQFGLADDPSVKAHGFSFLAQVISGDYDHVTIDAKGVPVQDTLRDLEVHVDLMGVEAPLGDLISGELKDGVRIREVEGQVRVKASDINRAVLANENPAISSITNLTVDPATPVDIKKDPEDQSDEEKELSELQAAAEEADDDTTAGVRMCATSEIGGDETDICVYGTINLVETRMTFTPGRLDLRNDVLGTTELSPEISAALLRMFTISLEPGDLPFTVTPTSIKVSSGVLSLRGKAKDVVLGGSGG